MQCPTNTAVQSHIISKCFALWELKSTGNENLHSFPWRKKCDSHSFISVWVKEMSPTTIQMNTGVFSIASLEKSKQSKCLNSMCQ